MGELEAIGEILGNFVKNKNLEREKAMGGRYLVTGVQLGMIKAELKIIQQSIGDNKLKSILEMLEEIHDDQFIGNSKGEMSEDTNDMRNLWASWCGETGDYDLYFTVYWRSGQRDIVKGKDLADALTHAGYGQGAIPAMDFHCNGIDDSYEWNRETKEWDRKEKDGTNHQ
jgi:hypothetical protein